MYAKVVRNSVNQQNNYIVLHRGKDQGVKPDLGVIGTNGGVVGTVVDVSKNFSIVMSLLHSQSNTSARLSKGGETGSLVWDGLDRNILLLKGITKSARISQGDSVVTSGFSDKFPPDLLIGYVRDIINDKSSSTYTVRVNSAVNFETLQFAYIIDNLQSEEVNNLMKKVKSK
jgi:rod shape-determining protein MreC